MEVETKISLKEQIFENHYNYYKIMGVETIKIDSGHIEQVSADYQGRIIYELLQNAFDKAEKNILVQVKDDSLYVANDGCKFTFNANHDYLNGAAETEFFKRYDFQSICSISTSTKNGNDSIGNKGVGFKSVFSIADYANIYTKGKVINRTDYIDEIISFRLYDSFNNPNSIPEKFDESVKVKIREKIIAVQKEDNLKNRGVPGYYFPLHIVNEDELFVNELFDKGYVTIIEVPFTNEQSDTIDKLLKKIKKIHFNFVHLKIKKELNVIFKHDNLNLNFLKQVKADLNESHKIISVSLGDKLIEFKKKPGDGSCIPQVALISKLINNKGIENDEIAEEGLIYNYLPTEYRSPFKSFDFNGDFYTTVNRRDIITDGEIGEYNKALLRACLELYFVYLNSYLNIEDRVNLSLKYINPHDVTDVLNDFNWNLILFENSKDQKFYFKTVREILRITELHFEISSKFFSSLAKKYFEEQRNESDHRLFFENVKKFIVGFSTNSSQYNNPIKQHIKCFSEELLKNKVKLIPVFGEIGRAIEGEIFYRKPGDISVQVPQFTGIMLTDFRIDDERFNEYLKIKSFSQFNEILKNYRQISTDGRVSDKSITEYQQQELLLSISQIIKEKKDFNSTHRYIGYLDRKTGADNSINNLADFAVSTVFLKVKSATNNPLYKPAQLCHVSELDDEFLSIIEPENLTNFKKYLGVSFEGDASNKYLFVDGAINKALSTGINNIPAMWSKGGDLVHKEITSELAIIYKNTPIHPALINDNYSFLENIKHSKKSPDFNNLLVGNYESFPPLYIEKLKMKIDKTLEHSLYKRDEIIKLYQRVFHVFHKLPSYLVLNNSEIEWTPEKDFVIFPSKFYFDKFKNAIPEKVSCYYWNRDLNSDFENQQIKIELGQIEIEPINEDSGAKLKKELLKKVPYILSRISQDKNSGYDFIYESKKYEEIQTKLNKVEFIFGRRLTQTIHLGKNQPIVLERKFTIKENKVYIDETATNKDKAESINHFLFSSSLIVEAIEMILYKRIEDLNKEFDTDILNGINSKWKPDFQEKWLEFQKEILEGIVTDFNQLPNDWYCYNNKIQSDILVEIERVIGILRFKEIIKRAKTKFEGYFDGFELEIDTAINEQRIICLKDFLKKKNNFDATELLSRLKKINYSLGIEDEIDCISKDIEIKFSDFKTSQTESKQLQSKKDKVLKNVDEIDRQFRIIANKNIRNSILQSSLITTEIFKNNPLKKIFKHDSLGNITEENFEQLGASGEIDVLWYYIKSFLKLQKAERESGINKVYELIKERVGDSLDEYKIKCLENIDKNEELEKALIPFFYVTLHYKFAYCDLIVLKDGEPTLVEVKTTRSESNKRFYLSKAEIEQAIGEVKYEIVRVTDSSITFLGNPIEMVKDKIDSIKTDSFCLTPKNFEFNLF